MDTVFIKDLQVNCIIGVHDWEREQPQEVLINIEMYADLSSAGKSDVLEKSIDYDAVTKSIRSYVEDSNRFTLEALAEDISKLILSDSKVKRVCVTIEKIGILPYTRSVGITIVRPN